MKAKSAQMVQLTLQKRGCIDIPSTGASMYPFFTEGNIGTFTPFDAGAVRIGDVLLFVATTGQLIGHRVIRIQRDHTSRANSFLLKGDTNLLPDGWIPPERILGRLTRIRKKWIRINADGVFARFWGRLLVKVPRVTVLLRLLLRVRRKFARMNSRKQ